MYLNWPNKDKTLIGIDIDNNPIWENRTSDISTPMLKSINSYGKTNRDSTDLKKSNNNILIRGDNLFSLVLLNNYFKNSIKCVYIDPPFNTGKIFDHYADALDTDLWLSLVKARLVLMKELLSEDGAIFVHIDDKLMPHLKILMDEIFNLGNRVNCLDNHVTTIVWQKKSSPQNDAKFFSSMHDYILVYAKNINKLNLNLDQRTNKQNDRYKNIDNDSRGPWTSSDLTVKTPNPEWAYQVILPSGRKVLPSKSRSWGFSKERFDELCSENRIWFGKNGDSMPRLKRFLSEVKKGVVPRSLWLRDETGDNSEGKKEVKKFIDKEKDGFTTPKPEKLLMKILNIATNEGDWVLDAFLGSGTTCAVAHKMKRKWIGLENGNQIEDICIPRLQDVITGKDTGGISKKVNWTGGGGFKYYKLSD